MGANNSTMTNENSTVLPKFFEQQPKVEEPAAQPVIKNNRQNNSVSTINKITNEASSLVESVTNAITPESLQSGNISLNAPKNVKINVPSANIVQNTNGTATITLESPKINIQETRNSTNVRLTNGKNNSTKSVFNNLTKKVNNLTNPTPINSTLTTSTNSQNVKKPLTDPSVVTPSPIGEPAVLMQGGKGRKSRSKKTKKTKSKTKRSRSRK